MRTLSNGTIVPKPLDSPPNPPNIYPKFTRKAPITVVSLSLLDFLEWEITFWRDGKDCRSFTVKLGHVEGSGARFASMSSLYRFATLVRDMARGGLVRIDVGTTGWAAWINDADHAPLIHEKREVECAACDGTGICPFCYGDIDDHLGPPNPACHTCDGLGFCPFCNGEGHYYV